MRKIFARAKAVLESKGGEGYVDTAVKMIIAVVIGALLLGGLYYLFNSIILPGLAARIQENFTMSDSTAFVPASLTAVISSFTA